MIQKRVRAKTITKPHVISSVGHHHSINKSEEANKSRFLHHHIFCNLLFKLETTSTRYYSTRVLWIQDVVVVISVTSVIRSSYHNETSLSLIHAELYYYYYQSKIRKEKIQSNFTLQCQQH